MTPRIRLPDDHGFKVYLHFGDAEHGVPHVHIQTADGEVTIALGSESVAPHVLVAKGIKPSDRTRALKLVLRNQERLLRAWEELK